MKLGKMAHKLRLCSDSIILLKRGTEIAQKDVIDSLVDSIQKTNLSNIILIVVEDFDDIRIMDEKQMNVRGWFKLETLQGMIHLPVTVKEEEPADTAEEEEKE